VFGFGGFFSLKDYRRIYPGSEFWEEIVRSLIFQHTKGRGTLEETASLLTLLSEAGGHRHVYDCVEALAAAKITLPEQLVVKWARAAFWDLNYKYGALILYWGGCADSPLIGTVELLHEANAAARTNGDHGIARLFPVLLRRLKPKKHGTLSPAKARALAGVILRVYVERDETERDFLPGLLFRMIGEVGFTAQADKLILGFYMAGVQVHVAREIEAAKSALKSAMELRSH
jgi:hypothetical protein